MLMTNSRQSGFSLIELMVTLSIIAILASVAFPSYHQLIANTQIRSVTESIRNGLQVARAEAVKRNATVSFTLNNNTSWTVGCPIVNANCPAIIQAKPAKEGSSSTVTLAITDANTVSFTNLGTIDLTIPVYLKKVNVDNSSIPAADSKDLQVNIGAGGLVRVCDPNVTVVTNSSYCSPVL
jgi:type IV fimbrial biogenesis protein FimT